jgi:hypothetical protein
MRPAIAWVSSDRGLLVVGTSLVLGGLGYLWADCLRLWRVRRKMRDLVDLVAATTFTALIAGSAWAMRVYDSLPVMTIGVAAAALSAFALHRLLAPAARLLREDARE